VRRVPVVAWLCFAVAFANAAAWSLITPPIQVPDENAHFAWTQYLAETGKPARPVPGPVSAEQEQTIAALGFFRIIGRVNAKPPWTAAADAEVDAVARAELGRIGSGNALSATNNPPLYYILQSGVYWASPSYALLDRLAFMRLFSALMAGFTALLCFLFVREVLPGTPWAWPAAGLAVAFQPLAGFMGGGVNNDNLLYLGAAATFLAMARVLRRGLTVRRGVALGAVVGLALMSKWNFVGLVPGAALAVLVALDRARRAGALRRALPAAGVCAALAAAPLALYLIAIRTVWERPVVTGLGSVSRTADGAGYDLRAQLSYAWQDYLPRLPFMNELIPGPLRLEDLWFNGFIGRFGWLDFGFTPAFYDWALGICLVLLALAVVALVRGRALVRERIGELASYAAAMGGLLALIAVIAYRYWVTTGGGQFEQARYLLPLLALYAAVIGLALRAAGPRWGPVLGAVVVLLAAGHSLAAQLTAIGRWYV